MCRRVEPEMGSIATEGRPQTDDKALTAKEAGERAMSFCVIPVR